VLCCVAFFVFVLSAQCLKVEVRVLVADMDGVMQTTIIDEAKKIIGSLEKNAKEKEVAAALRSFLDQQFGKAWHVIVGANFGSSVSSLAMRFLYFYVNSTAILCFQTK
jgi:dynein light chain LC8-type